ncbi:hypothetical protein NEIRO03_0008 [Nematocida sp. AWRm78]|nr:hypothetical protein NEIRO02_0005 [Nematocida sp. AWRm79]KAI5182324.1 hypothetical protein NEIRO03_0008 [Nematocida sp. AWRm78]
MSRKARKRAELYEKLYKDIRRNVKMYSKKETADLIKMKYSELWTEKKSIKDREIDIGEIPADASKEVYYIAADGN